MYFLIHLFFLYLFCCQYIQWVIVIKRQLSNFSIYHGENKLIFNEMMMMRFALYYINTFSWIFIVLK